MANNYVVKFVSISLLQKSDQGGHNNENGSIYNFTRSLHIL